LGYCRFIVLDHIANVAARQIIATQTAMAG
jgi:hypothetical protein